MADAGKEQELKLDKGGSKKKFIIIIAALVLVVAGVAAFFLLKGGSGEGAEGEGNSGNVEVDPDAKKVFYVPIQSPFIFVASARPRGHTVQIKLSLKVRGHENQALATHHLPAVEGAITKATAEISYAQLMNGSGKDALKKTILKNIQARFNELESKPIIEEVLYDGFIIQ